MPNPVRLLICPEADADLYAYRRGREGALVRIIRGKRCTVLDRCMAEWAAAMQFPYCFEPTWDSFKQSLRDLHQAPDMPLVILITNVGRVLPRASDDFMQMLQALAEYSAQLAGGPSLEVILHAETRSAEDVQKRLASANVEYVTMDATGQLK